MKTTNTNFVPGWTSTYCNICSLFLFVNDHGTLDDSDFGFINCISITLQYNLFSITNNSALHWIVDNFFAAVKVFLDGLLKDVLILH